MGVSKRSPQAAGPGSQGCTGFIPHTALPSFGMSPACDGSAETGRDLPPHISKQASASSAPGLPLVHEDARSMSRTTTSIESHCHSRKATDTVSFTSPDRPLPLPINSSSASTPRLVLDKIPRQTLFANVPVQRVDHKRNDARSSVLSVSVSGSVTGSSIFSSTASAEALAQVRAVITFRGQALIAREIPRDEMGRQSSYLRDPFLALWQHGMQLGGTEVVKRSLDPHWLPLAIAFSDLSSPVELRCWDTDGVTKDQLLGQATVSVQDLLTVHQEIRITDSGRPTGLIIIEEARLDETMPYPSILLPRDVHGGSWKVHNSECIDGNNLDTDERVGALPAVRQARLVLPDSSASTNEGSDVRSQWPHVEMDGRSGAESQRSEANRPETSDQWLQSRGSWSGWQERRNVASIQTQPLEDPAWESVIATERQERQKAITRESARVEEMLLIQQAEIDELQKELRIQKADKQRAEIVALKERCLALEASERDSSTIVDGIKNTIDGLRGSIKAEVQEELKSLLEKLIRQDRERQHREREQERLEIETRRATERQGKMILREYTDVSLSLAEDEETGLPPAAEGERVLNASSEVRRYD